MRPQCFVDAIQESRTDDDLLGETVQLMISTWASKTGTMRSTGPSSASCPTMLGREENFDHKARRRGSEDIRFRRGGLVMPRYHGRYRMPSLVNYEGTRIDRGRDELLYMVPMLNKSTGTLQDLRSSILRPANRS